jgi:GT2 family glycosyltransferase
MKHSTVAILINYNGFKDTYDCIKSIKQSKGELPYIVVVDNASNDANELELLQKEYELLHIIYNNENVGFGRANNIGIRWAQDNLEFEFLLLLNNDTLIEPDTLKYLIEPFSKDPQIAITTGKTMYEGNRDIVWYGGGEINYKRGWPKIIDYNSIATADGANKSKYVSFISGCTMMFSKNSIEVLKGFDDEFFMYCEDFELCMRAKKKGFKLYYESRCLIYHKVQASLKKTLKSNVVGMKAANPNLKFLFYHMKSNQYSAMKKNLSGFDFLIFFFIYWLEFFQKISYFVCKGRIDIVSTGLSVIKKNIK